MADFDKGYYWMRLFPESEWQVGRALVINDDWEVWVTGSGISFPAKEVHEWGDRIERQAKEVLEVGKSILRCTWCDHEIEETGLVLRHNDDPFCNQVCLDLQREDDALFAEVEEVLGDE